MMWLKKFISKCLGLFLLSMSLTGCQTSECVENSELQKYVSMGWNLKVVQENSYKAAVLSEENEHWLFTYVPDVDMISFTNTETYTSAGEQIALDESGYSIILKKPANKEKSEYTLTPVYLEDIDTMTISDRNENTVEALELVKGNEPVVMDLLQQLKKALLSIDADSMEEIQTQLKCEMFE